MLLNHRLVLSLTMSRSWSRPLVLLPLFLLGFVMFITPRGSYEEITNLLNQEDSFLCVDTNLALASPPVEGLVMKNSVPPSQWMSFDTRSEEESDRRIFFHETTGRMDLTMRQTCVIESAAKHNPDRPLHLFVRPLKEGCSPVTENQPPPSSSTIFNPLWLEILTSYSNVKPILINENFYFHGSRLEEWFNRGEWRNSPHEKNHMADYIRILTLHKGGGLYLDLDILILKPLNETIFRNCLAYENALSLDSLGNSIMHLKRGHWLPVEIMQLLSEEYDPQDYAYHGPQAVSTVMHSLCGMTPGNPSSNICKDVRLLGSHFFFPIERPFSDIFYLSTKDPVGAENLKKINSSYGAHLWSSMSGAHTPYRTESDQIFNALARVNCPLTFSRATQFRSL